MMGENRSAMANYPKAEQEMKEQARATLGDERYAAYERAQDQRINSFRRSRSRRGWNRL